MWKGSVSRRRGQGWGKERLGVGQGGEVRDQGGQGWDKEERSGVGQGGEVRGGARRRGQGWGKEERSGMGQGGEVRDVEKKCVKEVRDGARRSKWLEE